MRARLGLAVLAGLSVPLWGASPAQAQGQTTQITTCPTTITKPGNYVFAPAGGYGYCIVGSGQTGITIEANGVSLNMQGHQLFGAGDGTGTGILVKGAAGVRINRAAGEGGIIAGFQIGVWLMGANGCRIAATGIDSCSVGIRLDSSSGNEITGNDCSGNLRGIQVVNGSNNTVSNNSANGNANEGIRLGLGATMNFVEGNTTQYNAVGITVLGGSNGINNNQASYNSSGIVLRPGADGNGLAGNVTDQNHIAGSFGGEGIDIYSNSNSIYGNEANGNDASGIVLRAGAISNTIQSNTAKQNGGPDLFDDNPAPNSSSPCPNTWITNSFGTTGGLGAGCIS